MTDEQQRFFTYDESTVVVPIDERPGSIELKVGKHDNFTLVLTAATAVQLAGDLLMGVEVDLSRQQTSGDT